MLSCCVDGVATLMALGICCIDGVAAWVMIHNAAKIILLRCHFKGVAA